MPADLFDVSDDDGVVVRVHVQPGAGRTAVVGRHGNALKIRVAAPPEGGRANEAAAELLAEVLGVAASHVSLASGQTSRTKRFRVAGVDAAGVDQALDTAIGVAGAQPGKKPTGREQRGPRIR